MAGVTLIVLLALMALATRRFLEPTVPVTTEQISAAIAKAEGWFPGSLSWRNNNPGNLKMDGVHLTTFYTLEEGWAALHRQINLMLTGRSAVYRPSMTLRDVAMIYTGNDKPEAWANIVSQELGVSPDTTLGELAA